MGMAGEESAGEANLIDKHNSKSQTEQPGSQSKMTGEPLPALAQKGERFRLSLIHI